MFSQMGKNLAELTLVWIWYPFASYFKINLLGRLLAFLQTSFFFFFAGINSLPKISLLVKKYFGAKGSEEYSKIDGLLCVRCVKYLDSTTTQLDRWYYFHFRDKEYAAHKWQYFARSQLETRRLCERSLSQLQVDFFSILFLSFLALLHKEKVF